MLSINISEMNSENFKEKINQKRVAIVDIWAEWCGPCKQLSPIIEQVSSEMGDKIIVGKMDADLNLDFVKELNVRNIPTILYLKDGEVVNRTVGLKTKKEILEIVEKLLND